MVQLANRKGRESGSGMKGEVDSSILSGSTIVRTQTRSLGIADYESGGQRLESFGRANNFKELYVGHLI